jgi:hypothetical protein
MPSLANLRTLNVMVFFQPETPNRNVEMLAVKIYSVLHGSIQTNKAAGLGKLLTVSKSLVKVGRVKRERLQQFYHQLAMALDHNASTIAPG